MEVEQKTEGMGLDELKDYGLRSGLRAKSGLGVSCLPVKRLVIINKGGANIPG